MINGINFSCQGESHKATDKPCQDYSYCTVTNDGIAIAIVCDGHGGERYFRSKEGAEFAAKVTEDAVLAFIRSIDKNLFIGKPYTSVGPILPEKGDVGKPTRQDFAFRQLFSNIIFMWKQKLSEHANSHPLTEWEIANVKDKYKQNFDYQLSLSKDEQSFEKTYGCTLMVYVQTPSYWFAFHLGDGKMIAYKVSNGNVQWKEPVPWDDRCFLNKTTSLCDSNPLDEFRYCYEGDGNFPDAVFLGSDGLDDSFGEETNLVNFYIQIIKMLANEGIDETQRSLEETLPQLSKIGSKDDMSVATIFNLDILKNDVTLFIDWQRGLVRNRIDAVEHRMASVKDKAKNIIRSGKRDNNYYIELHYAKSDFDRSKTERADLIKKYDRLSDELGDRHYEITGDVENLNIQEPPKPAASSTAPEEEPKFGQENKEVEQKAETESLGNDADVEEVPAQSLNKEEKADRVSIEQSPISSETPTEKILMETETSDDSNELDETDGQESNTKYESISRNILVKGDSEVESKSQDRSIPLEDDDAEHKEMKV